VERPTIRTYKIRGTRITNAQTAAINAHWATYGIEPGDQIIDPRATFPDADRVVMEIGFGMGESTAQVIQSFRIPVLLE
jgi:tRNA (guanine-N7-)-methyltransferase